MSRLNDTINRNSRKVHEFKKERERQRMMSFQSRAEELDRANRRADRNFAIFTWVMLTVLVCGIAFLGWWFGDLIASVMARAV